MIFSWEYYGFHSSGGAALSRRVRQVAESFAKHNYHVTVIYQDHTCECKNSEYVVTAEKSGIVRIPVIAPKKVDNFNKISIIRRLQTLYYVLFHGDRSYFWAKNVIKHFSEFDILRPDLIISFFTPCGPLFLGDHFSNKLKVPWIADLKDTFDEGLSNSLIFWGRSWRKQILSSAKARIHVSPEWAERDGKILKLEFNVIRHAVPEIDIPDMPHVNNISNRSFKIFYGGSLHKNDQSLTVLKNVLNSIGSPGWPVELHIAGPQYVYDIFLKELSPLISVVHLGWLDQAKYSTAILNCDCSLVIPWSNSSRQVIPSKFYELCAFHKPIWIVGPDTGSFTYLLKEWEHPAIPFDDISCQTEALTLAMTNDFSHMFNIDNCKKDHMRESDFFNKFSSFIDRS